MDEIVFNQEHIEKVLAEMKINFDGFFVEFSSKPIRPKFEVALTTYLKEQEKYITFLDPKRLEEYDEDDPNAFKSHIANGCPIIHRCLMAQDEVMKDYKRCFRAASGRNLLNATMNIVSFGREYIENLHHEESHEQITTWEEMCFDLFNKSELFCPGVIGYGIQSSFLYYQYPYAIAYRSQNAMWALYFLAGREKLAVNGGSEFIIIRAKDGTCEQNFTYPPQLFAFYALQIYKFLKEKSLRKGFEFNPTYRYVYLNAFLDHVADSRRSDINCLKRSSEDVEEGWH